MDMIADRVVATRRQTFVDTDDQRRRLRRTMGIAMLGGATLDNEENYLIKKLGTAWGPCRSRTRPVFDTPPPFPVREPPSVAAARRSSTSTRG
jgi:hypothetical protein